MELKVPPAGESISTVLISEWLVEEGDEVSTDQVLVVLETDKINVEVPSPGSGVLETILKQSGEEADIGETIARLSEGASGASKPKKEKPVAASVASDESSDDDESPLAGPAARRLMAENKLSADEIDGTGKGGRVLKEDVLAHLKKQSAKTVSEPAPKKAAPTKAAPVASKPARVVDPSEREEVVPMTPLRRRIAERLVEAQQNAAILTTFNEVDMSRVMELRKTYQDRFVKKYDIKLGFMSFFVKACVEALKAYPIVNAEIRDASIVYKNHYDIGVAVGTERGLVVPVLKNADALSLAGVELGIKELATKARDMKLTMDDLEGGTFTISNGGIYGSMLSTPILNPPQSGILGLHNIIERPVAVDGRVEIRPMMYLALSYDHRLIDGQGAVSFLIAVKNAIEDPTRILLEI